MRSLLWVTLAALWFGVVAFGLVGVTAYEATPSQAKPSVPRWPTRSGAHRSLNGPTLLLFAHPHCPCTRATLAELQRVLAHPLHRPQVLVYFVRPTGVPAGWEQTDLWRTAVSLPGATVLPDEAGKEARQFGVVASGHVLLYDEAGRLAFSGGITSARGHEGANRGTDALQTALSAPDRSAPSQPTETPVFGCALLTPEN